MGKRTTNPEHPDQGDRPVKRDGYAKFCESKTAEFLMKKLENAQKNADEGRGTPHHPRLEIEAQLARTQLDHAILEEKHVTLEAYAHELNEQLQAARAAVDHLQGYVESLPMRLQILEASYAHLSMVAHGHSFVDKVLEAYQKGQKSNQPKESK